MSKIKVFLFSIFILIISYVVFLFLTPAIIKITLEPVYINAPMNSVFECLKNQFKHKELYKKFDSHNAIVDVDIDNKKSTETLMFFSITKQHQIVSYIDYYFKSTLDCEMVIDEKNKIISVIAKSRDGLVISKPTTYLEETDKGIKITENYIIEVPKLFESFTIKTAKEEHDEVLLLMKTEIEKNNFLCFK